VILHLVKYKLIFFIVYLAPQLFLFNICLCKVPDDISFSHNLMLLPIFVVLNSVLQPSKRFVFKWLTYKRLILIL